MNKIKSHNPIDQIYAELQEEDRKYGTSKKLERPQSEVSKKRPLKNLKKAWESHLEDFDECDDFFER